MTTTTTAFPTGTWQLETSATTVTIAAMKGKSSTLDVTIADVDVSEDHASFTASAAIDRTDIGVDKLPTLVIGRDLQLTVAATAAKTS